MEPPAKSARPAGNLSQLQQSGPSFQQILQEKIHQVPGKDGLRFSAHAQKRLQSRDIQLTEADMSRLNDGVNKADAKGARESLILMDGLAFVVSVPNRTVVTAVDGPDQRGAVFTQIDSAVFV